MGTFEKKASAPSGGTNVRLSVLERTAYGFGNFGNALVFTIIGSYLIFYYTDMIGLDGTIIGWIMLFSRIFDGITDLVMGRIVDKTKSKYGKGRVWILRIALPYAVTSVILFSVPISAPLTFQYIFVFLSYNLVNSILYTALAVPYNALGCLMTGDPHERNLLGIFMMGLSCAASVFLNAIILKLVDFFGNTPTAWTYTLVVFAIIGFAAHMFCFFCTKERILDSGVEGEQISLKAGLSALIKNKYWVIFLFTDLSLWMMTFLNNSSAVYYTKGVLNNTGLTSYFLNIGLIMLIVFLPVANFLDSKIGKGRTFLLGCVIMMVGYVIMVLFTENTSMMFAGLVLRGVGNGLSCGCILGITADTIDYSDWKFGVRATGIGNAAISFAQKVASGLSAAILGWVIDIGGYDGALTAQSSSAVLALKTLFVYLPAIFVVIMIVLMFQYKLDSQIGQIAKELEKRGK